MSKESSNLKVDRGIALHKMIRLVTLATAGDVISTLWEMNLAILNG
jgi:hypothetical protein